MTMIWIMIAQITLTRWGDATTYNTIPNTDMQDFVYSTKKECDAVRVQYKNLAARCEPRIISVAVTP